MSSIKFIIVVCIYFPFALTYFSKMGGVKVEQDIDIAYKVCYFYRCNSRFRFFINMIYHFPEWRQVYLMRIGKIGRILELIYGKDILLRIHCNRIGGGLYIHHGHSTEINATEIGEKCQIWQNVTIGVKYPGGKAPVIGNKVKISTGACILGDITVGDNVVIGANAVVINDIPANTIAVGVPAIVKSKSKQASQLLINE